MSELDEKRMAVAFGLFAFIFLAVGSGLSGARLMTSFIRGVEGGLIFGLLVWALGLFLVDKDPGQPRLASGDADDAADKGQNIDKTA